MYDFDALKLYTRLVPWFLRKPIFLSWLRVLSNALTFIQGLLLAFVTQTTYDMLFNAQVIYLEHTLNDLFDSTPDTYIENVFLPPFYLYNKIEAQPPVYFRNASEGADPVLSEKCGRVRERDAIHYSRRCRSFGRRLTHSKHCRNVQSRRHRLRDRVRPIKNAIMNSLVTDINGGYPWVLDDFRWHHDAERAALQGLIKGLALESDNCRLHGVLGNYLDPDWQFTEGHLLIDGEIIKVDAQTVPDPDLGFDYYHVVITETFDPAGDKSLEDGGTGNAYKQRRGTIQTGNFPIGSDKVITLSGTGSNENFKSLPNLINESIGDWGAAWTSVGYASLTPVSANINSITGGAIRYKHIGRVIHLNVDVILDMAASGSFVDFELPEAIL